MPKERQAVAFNELIRFGGAKGVRIPTHEIEQSKKTQGRCDTAALCSRAENTRKDRASRSLTPVVCLTQGASSGAHPGRCAPLGLK